MSSFPSVTVFFTYTIVTLLLAPIKEDMSPEHTGLLSLLSLDSWNERDILKFYYLLFLFVPCTEQWHAWYLSPLVYTKRHPRPKLENNLSSYTGHYSFRVPLLTHSYHLRVSVSKRCMTFEHQPFELSHMQYDTFEEKRKNGGLGISCKKWSLPLNMLEHYKL